MKKTINNQQLTINNLAFTLLEMLVVIGIIAILVTLGFASYSTAQKKARDAKRQGDLKAIQSAYEQYYSICDFNYPDALPASGSKLTATTIVCTSLSADVDLLTIPKDPLGDDYECPVGSTCNTSGFKICPPAAVSDGKMLETKDCTDQSCCVTNQQ